MDSVFKEELDKKFGNRDLSGALGVAAGRLSMCWSKIPKGVFNSTEAAEIVEYLTHRIDGMYAQQMRFGPIVDAHSAKSGLFDPRKEAKGE